MKKRLLAFFLSFVMVFTMIPTTVFAADADSVQVITQEEETAKVSLTTSLTDGMVQKGSRRTFDVWARDASGNKIASSVTLDGKSVSYNWDDSVKTSYTLSFKGLADGEHTVVVSATADGETKTLTYKIIYEAAAEGDLIGYATIDVELFTISNGWLIEPVKIPIYEGDNAAEALAQVIWDNGYDLNYTGSLESGFYLSAIIGANYKSPKSATNDLIIENPAVPDCLKEMVGSSFDATDGQDGSIGEFDFNYWSGWMYCLNNVFPNVGFADSYLADGDVVRVQFTIYGYGMDIGGGYSSGTDSAGDERANKDDLIDLIASVNSSANKSVIMANEAAAAAYEKAKEVALVLNASQDEVNETAAALETALDGKEPEDLVMEKEMTLENMTSKKLEVSFVPADTTVPAIVSWSTSDKNVATVNADGTVTATGAGTAVITAEWSGITRTCTVIVPEIPMTGISFAESEVEIPRASKQELEVVFEPWNTTDSRETTWSSSDEDVAIVSDGVVLGVKPGTATITAQVGEFTTTCDAVVKDIPLTGLATEITEYTLQVNKTQRLSYTAIPENTTDDITPTAVSSDTSIVKVAGSGAGYVTVSTYGVGEADVIVKVGTQSLVYHFNVVTINATDFEIYSSSSSITIEEDKAEIVKNQSASLSLTFEPISSPDDRANVEWTSSDTDVVTLSKTTGYSNTLKAVGAGTATVTAKLGDIVKTLEVTVIEKPLESIYISAGTTEAYINNAVSLTLKFNPTDASDKGAISWTSSNTDVVAAPTSTNQYCNCKILSEGTTTITATCGEFTASIEVTGKSHANDPLPAAIAFTDYGDTLELPVNGSQRYLGYNDPTGTGSIDTSYVTLTTSDENVVSVRGTNYMTPKAAGTATVTLTYTNGDLVLTDSIEVTVKEYPVEGAAFKADSYTITGEGNSTYCYLDIQPSGYTDTVTVTAESSDEEIVTITSASKSNIRVTGVKMGEADVTATITAGDKTFTTTTKVVVTDTYITSVAFVRNTFTINKGSSLSLSSYMSYAPSDGRTATLTWSSSDTSVATVNTSGRVTAKGYGEAVITATTKAGKEYSVTIVVPNPATEITLNETSIEMMEGKTANLEVAAVTPEDAVYTVTWASSNPNVATIVNGVVTGTGVGTATIYCTTGTATTTCAVTITENPEIETIRAIRAEAEAAQAAAEEAQAAAEAAQKAAEEAQAASEAAQTEAERLAAEAAADKAAAEAAQAAAEAAKAEAEAARAAAAADKAEAEAARKAAEEAQKAAEEAQKAAEEAQKATEAALLTEAKEKAVERLESYKDANDYRTPQQAELAAAIESGKAAIEAATTKEEVAAALAAAKETIDAIATAEDVENGKVFVDVYSKDYYYDAVYWAVKNGITTGIDSTHFSPSADCTRAQAVTFLWRLNGCPEPESAENPFTDVKEGTYYYEAVLWAVENGITNGIDDTHFSPDQNITRAQFVTFLWRMEGEPEAEMENIFADVKDGHYYYNAVLWAYENGITTGADETHFNPAGLCTRGQAVTFLYRA